jgi:hypothetical protein
MVAAGRLRTSRCHGTDSRPPSLLPPQDIATQATSRSGAVVNYSVSAADEVDPHPAVSCSPASGAAFPIGGALVTCTATDASGNQATDRFAVAVVELPVQLDINPGSPPFPIKLNGPPAISVIVRTTPSFDAATIKSATATLGDGRAPVRCRGSEAWCSPRSWTRRSRWGQGPGAVFEKLTPGRRRPVARHDTTRVPRGPHRWSSGSGEEGAVIPLEGLYEKRDTAPAPCPISSPT